MSNDLGHILSTCQKLEKKCPDSPVTHKILALYFGRCKINYVNTLNINEHFKRPVYSNQTKTRIYLRKKVRWPFSLLGFCYRLRPWKYFNKITKLIYILCKYITNKNENKLWIEDFVILFTITSIPFFFLKELYLL